MSERASTTVLPGVVDHHVHLGLIERDRLADGPVVEAHDLGWDPPVARGFRARPPGGVRVRIAGPFHTAPGGDPRGRSWAPVTSLSEVTDAAVFHGPPALVADRPRPTTADELVAWLAAGRRRPVRQAVGEDRP